MLPKDQVTAVRRINIHQYYVEYHFAPLPALFQYYVLVYRPIGEVCANCYHQGN